MLTPDGYKMYWDVGHYTYRGAKYIDEKIFNIDWFNLNN